MAIESSKGKEPAITETDARGKTTLKLHRFTEHYDHIKYSINNEGPNDVGGRVNGKNLGQGYIDCSGWVSTLLNKTMDGINKSDGKTDPLFKEKDKFDVVNGASAEMIFEKTKASGVIKGYNIADKLKEGMIIVENNPRESPKYDHIVIVVREPKSGDLMISQSSKGKGVWLTSVQDYLESKVKGGVKLHTCDPLKDARHLLKEDREPSKQQGRRGAEAEDELYKLPTFDKQQGKRRAEPEDDLYKLPTFDKQQGKRRAEIEDLGFKLAAFEQSGVVREQADSALNQTQKLPLLSEKTHPDHPLYTHTVAKLEQLGPQAFASRQQLENAAGSLVLEAKGSGMQRIDVVIQNRDGTGLFVVQGNPNDPASSRIYTDKSVATERSLAQSSNALLQDVQGQQQEQQRPRGSVIC